MKKFFKRPFYSNFKCTFAKKDSKEQKFQKRFLSSGIFLIVLVVRLITSDSLYAAGPQTIHDTVISQVALICLEASAHLLYSDLEHRLKKESKEHDSHKKSTVAAPIITVLEVLILCAIVIAISYILKQQVPSDPFPHLKTLKV